MAVQGGEDVYATLLLTDSYLPGALVLAHSLRDAGTTKKLAVLVTLDSVSAEVVTQLKNVYDHVIPVPRIKNEKPANLYLMNRADLHSAFTKINLWKQTQFRRIVYLDADVVAFRAPDELFDLPHDFSAAPDIGWPDIFNTGVMALKPNMGDYYAMMAMAERGISFDGADQGLLNMHFKNTYNRLSFTYNVTPSAHYQYIPAYRHFQSGINMVHFIGTDKPWIQGRGQQTGSSPFDEMVGRWWAVYDRHYRKEVPAPSETQAPPPAPELVQYFVKGEYQPTVSYVIPVGEPAHDHSNDSHGQHYQFPPPSHDYQQHHQHEPQHHEHSYHQHHEPDHEHHEHHHHHHHHDSSQSGGFQQPEQSVTPSSAVFGHSQETHTEAREEQASGHQQWAPSNPPHEPHTEHKPEPPQPPPVPSWDAQRGPPPSDSKPEAHNFPQTHYEMSSDPAPFVPPERYPSPPRDMWYEVPKQPPAPARQKPKPIFPWETHQPRASRVFANEEFYSEPPNETESASDPSEFSSVEHKSEPATPSTPTIHVTTSDPWSSFTRTNAWDEVPEIERYVDSLQQHRRTKSGGAPRLRMGGGLPGFGGKEDTEGWRRRGSSSKVTDFPSEAERPSLPVTPAPIRRPRFWGGGGPGTSLPGDEDDGDDSQQLPAAEGVPTQSDWDPVAQLQKLAKRQSELLQMAFGEGSDGSGIETGQGQHHAHQVWSGRADAREIPNRSLPYGSDNLISPTYVAQSATLISPQPVKPGSGSSSILGETSELPDEAAVPRGGGGFGVPEGSFIPEPAFHGPGAMFEKGEDNPIEPITPALPTDEEMDVLEA